MAPPPAAAPAVHPVVREVTEDTPPDLLEGTMDLMVILPSGKTVQTTVDRKTPMMDLLIHTATANKINPAGHIVQVRNERGIEMPYKPSTPIGALDTTTIEIVPKNRVNEYIIVKKPAKVANQPFETTFRLQVHLPRNQLHVMRVSSKIVLDEILREVCHEKNLDISKYEIRHPVNLDHKLPLSMTVGETGLQELTVVSKNSKINSSVSTADIIALQQSEEGRGKGCLDGSFKHSRSSVGDSSVSSESTGSGRGISPCRSEDSRSISPLPLIRPKTLIHSRTASNLSTCSSSGNSSTGQFKTNALNSSTLSSQVSHQQVVMQAPPRMKKRAAPQPPSTPTGAKVNICNNNSLNCSSTSLNISSPNATCTTPTNGVSNKAVTPGAGGPLERPTPRKKEAPREPPKLHHPLTHHQSLPLNHHSRHNSGSNATDSQQDIGPLVRPDSQQQLERVHHHQGIAKMSSGQSISSSMTNLTSVSSVSSTSLASSTGGSSKKRRAPKPPVLAAVKTPTQIEEETTTTDSDASTLFGGDGVVGGSSSANESNRHSPQRKRNHQADLSKTNGNSVRGEADEESEGSLVVVPDHPKEIEVQSASPVSSLSSPSNSSSPIPPSSSSQVTMKEQPQARSLNTNDEAGLASGRSSRAATGSQHEEHEYESESRSSTRSYSRSSSSPSSSSNSTGAPSLPHADSTSVIVERSSRNVPSSSSQYNAATTAAHPDAQSSSRNTQVSPPSSSSATSSSARATMPMPLPRRKAPPAPGENTSSSVASSNNPSTPEKAPVVPTKKISYERRNPLAQRGESKAKLQDKTAAATVVQQPQQQQNNPMPKPKPRPDRKSMESIPSEAINPNFMKPQINNRASTPARLGEMKSKRSQSTDSNPGDDSLENETNTGSSTEMQQQPVLSGQLKNPLAKYGVKVLPDNVLKERAERLKKTDSSADSPPTSTFPSAQTSNNVIASSRDVDNAQSIQTHHRKNVPIQRASQSSSASTTEDFSDTGSVTSFTKNHNISKGSVGKSGFASSKPVPSLAKSDYTSQGSVRSIKQLTSAVASMSAVESGNYNDDGSGEGGYESDNLEENLDFFEPVHENKKARDVGMGSSFTKSVSSSPSQRATSGPTSKQAADGRQNEKEEMVKSSAGGNKPRVFSSVSAYDDNDFEENSNLIMSPGAVSESGFGRNSNHRKQVTKRKSIEEDSNAKLNRWQNMVDLNEIETGIKNDHVIERSTSAKSNLANNLSDATNKPKVTTRSVSGSSSSSNKQNAATLLQGDYRQRTKIQLAVDESQNDSATYHSSESEASYTDSGVPATETVTPSPVNLDDVILDHEYHTGSHSEKFSSEDGEELKHSSRRSSIQSDHSEEWMNILEAKMNKDEEAIEKMFEAVLPPGQEISGYTPSPTSAASKKKANVDNNEIEQDMKEIRPVSQSRKRREIHTDSEDDYYEGNNKEIEKNDYKEMIETTVELHHVPAEREEENDEEDFIEDSKTSITSSLANNNTTSTSTVPVRKLSKSESFSHNSEFNEATQRRKEFKSSRGNAMNRGSQSSGSAADLRRSLSLSDSEEEIEEISPVVQSRIEASNKTSKSSNDRAVSMSDLFAEKMGNMSMAKMSNDPSGTNVHKATSLQKLSGEKEDPMQVENYRKQLEMQFEQWKTEFMKQHVGQTNEDTREEILEEVERTPANPKVVESEVELAEETDNLGHGTPEPKSVESRVTRTVDVPVRTAEKVQRANIAEESRSRTPEEITEKESDASVEKAETRAKSTAKQDDEEDEKMKNIETDEFPPVELRKKKEPTKVVVYQYAGPRPTIKMASWGEQPKRTISIKQDEDYIMGMGQQDPNSKANPGRIHSFHGGPVVSMTPPPQQKTEIPSGGTSLNKSKRESSPSPTPHIQINKGWSAALNASNQLPNSTGAVKSVLSAWKQRMEETEKEKNKPKEGPPAEIDIYGTENATRSNETSSIVKITAPPPATSPSPLPNGVSNVSKQEIIIEKTATEKSTLPSTIIIESQVTKPVVVEAKPVMKASPAKTPEKSKTLGSSFRTPEKPVVFTISSMESNTLPRKSTAPVNITSNNANKATTDSVDSNKPSPASSTIEISSSAGTLEDRKKFFQGIKPVENGKEAPIPAVNLKSNIATIQKVFEKQRMTKIQQMGSQQSLYSDGAVSPVPSLQRNDSLESRQSNLRRQNSIESHSSDSSSSVVLRVSGNSGKASPQLSSTEMVQKLFGRPSSMNTLDPLRRTPSPISSTTSTLSSSTSYERFTPSPTVVDGPNNSVRITTGGYKPPVSNQSSNIRSVGNKAIIIVNGEESGKNNSAASRDSKTLRPSAVNDNIVLTESGSNIKKSPVSNAYVSSILQQQQQQKQVTKRESAPATTSSVTQIKQNMASSSSFLKKSQSTPESNIVSQKNEKNAQPNGTAVPPPPPPPPTETTAPVKSQLSLDVKKVSVNGGNARNSKPSTPTSPMSSDPRAEIFNAIKNSNGNFGLKKTGSSILLK